MYKRRKDRYGKLRINKFKGLNQADNPRNIDDAELSIMKNLCLEKDGTIKSRKGWQSVTGALVFTHSICGVCKTFWEDVGSALYVMGSVFLYHINETTWAASHVGTLGTPSDHAQFLRYKDKLLFLFPGHELKYIDSSNDLYPVDYPEFRVHPHYAYYLAASAGGELEPDTTYQYCISVQLGTDGVDGETKGSLPSAGDFVFKGMFIIGDHTFTTTTETNKKITGANIQYDSTPLRGYDLHVVRLFRRKAQMTSSGKYGPAVDGMWEEIDMASIELVDDSYQLITNTTSNDDGTGIITDITGEYVSSSDIASLYIDFVDDNTAGTVSADAPREDFHTVVPKAKYMTRLYNRILLANIQGTGQEADKKKVYYSYRGDTGLGTGKDAIWEIQDFSYSDPMLIFPFDNHFYCDMEDAEDEITGMATYQDNVFIFTGKCTFLWREGMFEPMKIANDVGCISNGSICEFEGKLVWLAKNGVYKYDGSKVKNLTYEKVNKYIKGISGAAATKVSAAIHDRKYFLAVPLEGETANSNVLVYDFDLEEWYVYEYMFNISTNDRIYIDYLFNYSEGAEETLYAGVHRQNQSQVFMVKLESGYSDYWYHAANSSDGIPIEYELRTKYFDFEAPDIEKVIRNGFIRLCNYSGGTTLDLYVDQTDAADNSKEIPVPEVGFLIAGADTVDEVALGCSVLAGAEGTTGDYLENVGNASYAISWPQGLTGAAFQLGLAGEQFSAPLEIKSIGIDWLPKRKVARTIGG